MKGSKVPGLSGLRRVEAHGAIGDHVTATLLREVCKALPAEHACREQLLRWTNAKGGTEVDAEELERVRQGLLEFSHAYEGEEGELGRLEGAQAGLIVGPENGVTPIRAPVVLALALQRLLLLMGVGDKVEVTEAEEVESSEAA